MLTTTKALEKAEKLEGELALLTEEVARGLRKPASRRDTCHLADSWSEINRLRSQMQSIGGLLRKIKKPSPAVTNVKDCRTHRKAYERADGFLKRLRAWDEIELIVQRHIDPERKPLLPRLQVGRHDALLEQLYTALHRLANPATQDSSATDHGCFSDIAFPIQSFDLLMSAAYRIGLAQNPQRLPRFLDVGCGGGTKILAATRYFRQADGLEYDRGYAGSARRFLQIIGVTNSTVFHTDAMVFDAYSDYDVIYFFRPLLSDAHLETLEQRIIALARPGTILVAPYDGLLNGRTGMDCAKVEGPIFVTGIEQAAADQLRHEAEATSTGVLKRSADWVFDTGYWAPILDAASFSSDD